MQQIMELWSLFGDADTSPAKHGMKVSRAHIWGPEGTGKTAVLFDYLDTLKIRAIWLDCRLFTLAGEIQAYIVELLRRTTVEASHGENAPELPKELQSRTSQRQLRALDKLELAIRAPLDYLAMCYGTEVKVVIVLENAQDLSRHGKNTVELLTSLPELLSQGNRLAVVTEARLPLSSLGLMNADPPSVAFRAYTAEQAAGVLTQVLSKKQSPLPLQQIVNSLVKFAAPHLGFNMATLLSIGVHLLEDSDHALSDANRLGASKLTVKLYDRVAKAVEQRIGLGNLSRLVRPGSKDATDPVSIATSFNLQRMTKSEKRMLVSVYLGSRIAKEEDIQFFLPERRTGRSRTSNSNKKQEDAPAWTRAPRPMTLVRLFAIYHKLAGRANLVGSSLFEHLVRLRDFGYIRIDRPFQETDAKVICQVELQMIVACAGDLDIQLLCYLSDC